MTEQANTQRPVQGVTAAVVVQPSPATNPLMDYKNLAEFGGALALLLGLIAWFEARARQRRRDDADSHKKDHDAINKEINDLRHDVRNERSRVDQLERQDRDHDIRLAKVEQAMESFKEGQHRMEATMKENHREQIDMTKTLFDQISNSIREVRNVSPKGS